MTKLFGYIAFFLLTSCFGSQKYSRQTIIEQKFSSNGKLTSKKYQQLISSPGFDKLATITKEYDSLGRVIKEYGFDNPYFYSKNYLVETIYLGSYVYLKNKFIWSQATLTNNNFTYNYKRFDSTLEIFSQNIFPDSLKKHKEIIVTLSSKPNLLYYGQFEETFPDSDISWTSNLFDFELDEKLIAFDSVRRLILADIRRK